MLKNQNSNICTLVIKLATLFNKNSFVNDKISPNLSNEIYTYLKR